MPSAFVDPTAPTLDNLTKLSNLHPELSAKYSQISNLFSLKHWHQLTQAILIFLSEKSTTLQPIDPSFFNEGNEGNEENPITNTHQALYQKVVLKCDSKLNPQSLAQIASLVANSFSNPSQACVLLQNLLDTKEKILQTSGTLYTRSKLMLWKLHYYPSLPKDSTEALDLKQTIENFLTKGADTLKLMDGGNDEESSVHSAYYEASKAYYKQMGPPEAFFREGMLYLNYTPLKNLSDQELYELATDLSLSALTGEGVFHFGTVVNDTPILKYLEGTDNAFLLGWMKAMADGNVDEFHQIATKYASEISKHGVLVSMADNVKEKITLLALVDLVFKRPSAERTIEFTEIAAHIGVEVDQVEWVIMRALSLGLIKGSMDQVEGNVSVTWVMPRVLDDAQLQGLASRFSEWAIKVTQEREYMAEQTIFA